jgi:large subunit ribosomal protein L29
MKAKDLRERSQQDLLELEKSLAKDTFTARFKNFTNRLDDTSTIRKTKRDLARVKTLLREQQLNAGGDAKAAKPAKAKPAKKAAAPKAQAKAAKAAAPAGDAPKPEKKTKKASTKKASE